MTELQNNQPESSPGPVPEGYEENIKQESEKPKVKKPKKRIIIVSILLLLIVIFFYIAANPPIDGLWHYVGYMGEDGEIENLDFFYPEENFIFLQYEKGRIIKHEAIFKEKDEFEMVSTHIVGYIHKEVGEYNKNDGCYTIKTWNDNGEEFEYRASVGWFSLELEELGVDKDYFYFNRMINPRNKNVIIND